MLQRVDGVGEGRRVRIGGDRLDLGVVLGKGALEGRQEMLRRDPAERRNAEGLGPVLDAGVSPPVSAITETETTRSMMRLDVVEVALPLRQFRQPLRSRMVWCDIASAKCRPQ